MGVRWQSAASYGNDLLRRCCLLLEEGAIKAIEAAINRGNDAEVKIVQGNVVVIEIQRKLLYK